MSQEVIMEDGGLHNAGTNGGGGGPTKQHVVENNHHGGAGHRHGTNGNHNGTHTKSRSSTSETELFNKAAPPVNEQEDSAVHIGTSSDPQVTPVAHHGEAVAVRVGESIGEDAPKPPPSTSESKSYKLPAKHYSYDNPRYRTLDPGTWFWGIVFVVPYLFITVLYGVIPLHDPATTDGRSLATFALITAPITQVVLAYFYFVSFLFLVSVDRPFRTRLFPLAVVYLATAGITYISWLSDLEVPPRLFGAWIFLVTVVIVSIAIPAIELAHLGMEELITFRQAFKCFSKVMITLTVQFVILVLYVLAWRYGGEDLQEVLPILLPIIIFIFRKVQLALTSAFEIEVAMVISGFVVQNMSDTFLIMVFPSVKESSNFATLWLIPSATTLANLLFLTDRWFRFRIWVKEFLKRAFTCGKRGSPWDVHMVADQSHIPDDRGYSNNQPGYRRRQVRFYFWKVVSTACAMSFYLLFCFVLRYGLNEEFYPLSRERLTRSKFNNTIVFASVNIVFVALCGFFGKRFIKRRYPEIYCQVANAQVPMLQNHKYFGYLIVALLFNGTLAISIMLAHHRIYDAFSDV